MQTHNRKGGARLGKQAWRKPVTHKVNKRYALRARQCADVWTNMFRHAEWSLARKSVSDKYCRLAGFGYFRYLGYWYVLFAVVVDACGISFRFFVNSNAPQTVIVQYIPPSKQTSFQRTKTNSLLKYFVFMNERKAACVCSNNKHWCCRR